MRISDWSSDVCSSDLQLVEAGEQRGRRELVAIDADRIAFFEIDGDDGRLVGRRLRTDAARGDVLIRRLPGVLHPLALGGDVQPLGLPLDCGPASLFLADGELVRLGKGYHLAVAVSVALSPWRATLDIS